MKEAAVSLENAGAGLASWVRRAREERTIFVVKEGEEALAKLVPAESASATGAELARALAGLRLTPEEARAWSEDLREARAQLLPPEDRWP